MEHNLTGELSIANDPDQNLTRTESEATPIT
jgi:hypothetical protein